MRRALEVLIVLSLAAIAAYAFHPNPEASLYGTWTTRDGEQTVQIEFTPRHEIRLNLPQEGQETGTYRTDFSQVPPHMTIQTGSDRSVETVFTIVSRDEIRIMDNTPGLPCPAKVDDKAYVLKRQTP